MRLLTLARIACLCAVPVGALVAAGATTAAPITFNTALPVSQGEIIVRELITVEKAGDDPDDLGRELSAVTVNSVVAYGATADLALFGVLPVTFRQLETPAGTRDTRGIGDARITARYTVYRQDAIGKTTRIAPFIGVKVPTGDNARTDAIGLLPPNLQPGSGSWDFFGGIIVTFASVARNFDFQASYRANTGAGGIKRGDVARADASFQYRLLPRKLSSDDKGYLFGVIEANLVHADRMRVNGLENQDTGGTSLFLVPGLQYAALRWIAEIGLQIPVVQDLNGSAIGKDFNLLAGIRVNF